MEKGKLRLSIIFIVLLYNLVTAQSQADPSKEFVSEDISFSYPSGWRVSDKSTKIVQQINLVPDHGNALIVISAYRGKITDNDQLYIKLRFLPHCFLTGQ